MAEVVDSTANIVIDGYIFFDEDGQPVEVNNKVEHDKTKKNLNPRTDDENYIFQIEEHKEAEIEHYGDLNINHQSAFYYEVIKFEDGILDSTFKISEENLCVNSVEKLLTCGTKQLLVDDSGNANVRSLCSEVEQRYDVSEAEEQAYIDESTMGESSTRDPFLEYESNSNSDEKLFCKECQAFFSDSHSIEEHVCHAITRCKGSKVIPYVNKHDCHTCSFCQSRLKTFGGLQRHQLKCRMKPHKRLHGTPESQNSSKEIVCDICNTVFTSIKNLKLHRKIHDRKPIKSILEALPAGAEVEYNELSQFYCEICNKSFDQNLLAVHKNMHKNIEEYNCSICNRQFGSMPSYEMHIQLHTDKPRRGQTKAERTGTKLPFPCNYCGREFARPHEKVKHERIHTGEKPYECEVCGKTFRVSYSLTLHLRTHTDIRPYVCATCNKRFKSQPVYAHHLNTHLTERPYKCNICSKSFRTSVQLCGHKNSHTKPFSCIECNRPFATLYSVKVHMKTHSKSNKCSDILKHRCTLCGAVYARIFALRFHMKEHHSMEFGIISQELQLENCVDVKVAEHGLATYTRDEEDSVMISSATQTAVDNINVGFAEANTDQVTQTIVEKEEINVNNFHMEEEVANKLFG